MFLGHRHRIALWIAALVIPAAFLHVACSGQGEGERCSTLGDDNGTSDCSGDLVCLPPGRLNGPISGPTASTDGRCCPSDQTKATTLICQTPSAGGIDAAAPPLDAGGDVSVEGGEDAATPDGEADGAVDGGTDAGEDAPVDSPADG